MIVLVRCKFSYVLFANARQAPSRQNNRCSRLRQEDDVGWLRGPEGRTIAREADEGQHNTGVRLYSLDDMTAPPSAEDPLLRPDLSEMNFIVLPNSEALGDLSQNRTPLSILWPNTHTQACFLLSIKPSATQSNLIVCPPFCGSYIRAPGIYRSALIVL